MSANLSHEALFAPLAIIASMAGTPEMQRPFHTAPVVVTVPSDDWKRLSGGSARPSLDPLVLHARVNDAVGETFTIEIEPGYIDALLHSLGQVFWHAAGNPQIRGARHLFPSRIIFEPEPSDKPHRHYSSN